MRCFIAIDLPMHVKSRIFHKFELLFKKRLFKGKYTDKDSLHLTLKFFGEISEEKINSIDKELQKIKVEKFEGVMGNIGLFGGEENIKIIWVDMLAEEIYKLHKEINSVLKNGKKREDKFQAHITAARVDTVVNKNELLKELKNFNFKKLKFEVNEFLLMKSELTPEGPKYKVLKKYKLD